MRLMQAFKIQLDYQKHRKRVENIKSLNSRQRVSLSTSKAVEKINGFKQKRSISLYFRDAERNRQISAENKSIHDRLNRTYKLDPSSKILRCITTQSELSGNRSSSRQSLRSSDCSRIQQENMRLGKKINMTKSSYTKFRKTRKPLKITERNLTIQKLENQLVPKSSIGLPVIQRKPYDIKRHKQKSVSQRK